MISRLLILASVALIGARPGLAQTTGQILGRVIEAESGTAIPTVDVSVEDLELRTITNERGDFSLVGIPAGEHRLRAELIGYRTVIVPVRIRADRITQVTIRMETLPVELEGVSAEV
ncbi:MAG: carboxypeptidase-like regulatory domain-containing protein, partial [Gemmatimonadales bacterium]